MMTVVAGPWFVLETTGSAAKTGLVSAALVLVFVLSSFNTQGDTARYALVPALARIGAMSIERANAADRAVVRIGSLVGPLLAGVLIALIGATNVLFVDAVTFLTSATLVALGVPARAGRGATVAAADERGYASDLALGVPSGASGGAKVATEARDGSYLSGLLEGLRFVRANKLILSMVLVATIGNSLDKPLIYVIAPVYAKTIYNSAESLGLMVGAFGGGALAGTLLYGVVARRLPRRLTFLSCFVAAPVVGFGTLAATPPLGVVVAAAALAGLIAGAINPLFETVIQEKTPPEMLGRTFGTLTALAYAGIPIGSILAGVFVEGMGLVPTILGMGAIYLAVTVGMFFNPALRQMDAGKER
jgi:predicted MFS family arabinose efflux permease